MVSIVLILVGLFRRYGLNCPNYWYQILDTLLENYKSSSNQKNWREWWIPGKHKGEDQVGGFIWELEGLTMVAVKAAGFKASADQPISME